MSEEEQQEKATRNRTNRKKKIVGPNEEEIPHTERVIKFTFQGLINASYIQNPKRFNDVVDEYVLYLSRVLHRGSLLFNAYLLWMLNHGRDLPDLKNQQVYIEIFKLGLPRCHQGTHDANVPYKREFYEDAEHAVPPPPANELKGITNALTYAVKSVYQTNLINGIVQTFYDKQLSFLEAQFPDQDNRVHCWIRARINSWTFEIRITDEERHFVMTEDVQDLINNERRELGLIQVQQEAEGGGILLSRMLIKTNPTRFVQRSHYYLTRVEDHRRRILLERQQPGDQEILGFARIRTRRWMRRRFRKSKRRRLKKRIRQLNKRIKDERADVERRTELIRELSEILRNRPTSQPQPTEEDLREKKRRKNRRRRESYRRASRRQRRQQDSDRGKRRRITKTPPTPRPRRRLPKTWNLAPIHDLRRHHIKLDARVLFSIVNLYVEGCGEAGEPVKQDFLTMINSCRERRIDRFRAFELDGDTWFRRLFSLNKYPKINVPCAQRDVNKNFFSGMMETDGVGCSVHFYRKKHELSPRPTTGDDPDPARGRTTPHRYLGNEERVIAIDPGRVNLVFGVEKLADGSYKHYKFTQGQYYHDSHMSLNARRRQKWNTRDPVKASLLRLQEASPDLGDRSRSSSEDFLNYCRVWRAEIDHLWEHYTSRRVAHLRFDTYMHTKKNVDGFIQSLRGDKSVPSPVLAYGDGSVGLGLGMRNERPTPCKWLLALLRKHFKVVMVNEAYTTCRCFDCKAAVKLSKVYYRTPTGDERSKRGLTLCRDASCKSKCLKSRDLNAAKNILHISMSRHRPRYLMHTPADDNVVDN